ncbi:ADGRG2 [Branchiostoma lanceolatum]|uniref:ADGRG2 protein n=1 Tax=Branchiostoma lanceolatum TaxID=7740 RepID=A0A8J9YIR9_BRALA|nr:ADGRG2 [Branchiostoma lanceolatum]
MLVVRTFFFLFVLRFSDGRSLDDSLGISPWLLAASETLSETDAGSGEEDVDLGSGNDVNLNLKSTEPPPIKDATFAVNPVLQHTCRREEADGYLWPETAAPGLAEVPCIGEEADAGRVATRECGIVEMPEYGYSVAFWRGPDCSKCRVCKPATKSCKGESSYDMDWEDTPIGEVVEKPCDERLGLRGSSVKRRCVEYPPLSMAVWEVPDMTECVSAFANSTIFQTTLLEQYFTMYLNSTVQWMKRNVCPPETTFIEENRKGIFRWPLTLAGFPALADCPYGSILPSARLIRDLILDISLGVFQHQEIPVEKYNGTSLTDNFLNTLWTSSMDNFVESDVYKEGKEFFEKIFNKTGEGANDRKRQRRSEKATERIVVRRPEIRPRHLDHFGTSDYGGNAAVDSFNHSETTNQTQEPPSRNKVTWENFANVLLHLELLLRRASRKCVQNEDGSVSWTEPMTWMCRSKDSAPFEDLYKILSDSARVEAFISSVEHVTGDLGNFRTPDVELTLNMFETAHKVDQVYSPEIASTLIETISSLVGSSPGTLSLEETHRLLLLINTIVDDAMTDNMTSYSVVTDNVVVNIEKVEPQAFPGMTFVSLHGPSNLTNYTDHGGSGNLSLRNHTFQTIPGDLQETVRQIDISVLSELIYIPHAVFDDADVRAALDANCSWHHHSHNLRAIQFVLYENDRLFPSDINGQNDLQNGTNSTENHEGLLKEDQHQLTIGSRVLASKIQGRCVKNLTEPVVIILKHKMKGRTPKCVFWDFGAAGGAGAWSTEGCWVHQTVDDVTECHCNHLTNFALIMDIADQFGAGPLPAEHRTALNWISWLGCGLSMAGLIGTLVSLLFVRSLRQLKTTPCHVNLSAAMLLAMVSLQVGVKQTDSRLACGVQAALIQYFLLVSLAWMAVEALLMYQNLVKVVLRPPRFFFCRSCVTAWVVPAIVVTASVFLRWDSYGADDRCWISDTAVFFATFFVPSMIIVVFNSVIFGLVIRSLMVRKVPGDGFATRRRDRVREARSAIGLMVLLGLTYLFGSFTVGDARLVFQYIFAITNSIQGFLIFLFFAVIPLYRQRTSKKNRSDLHSKMPSRGQSKMSVMSLDVSSRLRRSSSQSTVESFTEDCEAVRRKVGTLPAVKEVDEEPPETDDDGRTSTDILDETRTTEERESQRFSASAMTETLKNDDQSNPTFLPSSHGYCTRGRVFGHGFLRRAHVSTSESEVDLTLWDGEQC